MMECAGPLPLASGVGRYVVSVLTHAPSSTRSPFMSALCHAPCGMPMVPGMMRGVTKASMRISPAGLFTATVSPLAMPRDSASAGLIHSCWRATCSNSGMKPKEEWVWLL